MDCATKRRWPSMRLAHGHVLLLLAAGNARRPDLLHAYACDCGGFHVGHSTERRWDPISWNARTSAVITHGGIGDGYSRRKC